jgi:hypothetical protein
MALYLVTDGDGVKTHSKSFKWLDHAFILYTYGREGKGERRNASDGDRQKDFILEPVRSCYHPLTFVVHSTSQL